MTEIAEFYVRAALDANHGHNIGHGGNKRKGAAADFVQLGRLGQQLEAHGQMADVGAGQFKVEVAWLFAGSSLT